MLKKSIIMSFVRPAERLWNAKNVESGQFSEMLNCSLYSVQEYLLYFVPLDLKALHSGHDL